MKFKELVIFGTLFTSVLYATNGDQMIATGTRSMGMGGVGIAMGFGAESGLINPALISDVKSSEVIGSATLFWPQIETKALSSDYTQSLSDVYLMPSFAYATKYSENLYISIGAWGVAGMGVDFSNAQRGLGLMGMQTDLMLLNIATPIAWSNEVFSIGIAPILQLGMLDIEYNRLLGSGTNHPFDKEWEANGGASIGIAWKITDSFRVGAMYKSAISMRYNGSNGANNLDLEQPQQYGVGISYSYTHHTVAFDYKEILWSEADGYSNFGWQDQKVYAVGYQYDSFNGWVFRMGYNYGKSAIDTSHKTNLQNYLNLLGFPATSEQHYTVGGSFDISDSTNIDIAFVYSPTKTKDGIIYEGDSIGDVKMTNRHKELSFTAQIRYRF